MCYGSGGGGNKWWKKDDNPYDEDPNDTLNPKPMTALDVRPCKTIWAPLVLHM